MKDTAESSHGLGNYIPTIGLEIHAELKTRAKMFCDCRNDSEEQRPNHNVCPICMGHPGTLPTINKEAVKHVLTMGTALGSKLADYTEFDRKNYFYPDIPKGYQISQYKYPLVTGGSLHDVAITRIHLEEDTASSTHTEGGSLINFNRSSVPLMELVTEPVIHSGSDAADFARELQLLLQYLGIADANMEKGEMRVEANISVSTDPKKFGTKVEVKNLNSFRAVEKAIAYEIKRHIALLEKGEKIVQETRGFDESKETTFSQRKKEDSHDYRYFPDPDLPKLYISQIPDYAREVLRKAIPELPAQKRERYTTAFGLKAADVEFFVNNPIWAQFFEKVIDGADKDTSISAANYIVSDLMGLVKQGGASHHVTPEAFRELIGMVRMGDISSRGAKDLLKLLYESGGMPKVLAEQHGLLQKSNEEELKKVIETIVQNHQNVVAEYKAGKQASLQFLIGQAMKITKGSANPQVLKALFEKVLA